MAKSSGIPLSQCPTCLSKETEIHTEEGGSYIGRESGTFRYKGEEHKCDCEYQMALRRQYLVANIGDQYQRLDWGDYRDAEVRENVDTYLSSWDNFKIQGMGIEFSSPQLGTGKTFAATHIAKELIKRGERVFFVPFLEIISLYQSEDRETNESRLKDVPVLVLDEVVPFNTEAQGQLFASKFEELIRHRTNFNKVTIMTTNLTPEKLLKYYPRPYSLLAAKQVRIELEGEDARQYLVRPNNLEMIANNEVRPLT